jgi:hypothetical protein
LTKADGACGWKHQPQIRSVFQVEPCFRLQNEVRDLNALAGQFTLTLLQ